MTTPDISCIVPTFERADLVSSCLAGIAAQREIDIDLIVTDDSASDSVRELVVGLGSTAPRLRYLEGARSGNPVDNWNAGLDAARAPWRVVVHQDERLIDPLYLRHAVDALSRTPAVACRAGVRVTGVNRRSRFGLVSPLASRLPWARQLLPLINWIGPTAAFVFGDGWRFDPAFVQLVDVDLYARVLATGPLATLPGIGVASLGHHDDQISARIDRTGLALVELRRMALREPPTVSPLASGVFAAALKLKNALR